MHIEKKAHEKNGGYLMVFFYSLLVFIFNHLLHKFHIFQLVLIANKQALLATFGLLVEEQYFNLTIHELIPGHKTMSYMKNQNCFLLGSWNPLVRQMHP